MIFADASALVKRYVRERHSAAVRRWLAAGPVAVSRLSEVEVPSALTRLVRERRLSAGARDRLLGAFAADLAAWHIVEVTADITTMARAALLRHDLRAGDAVQLASALWLRQATPLTGLLAFDTRLVTAARSEQLEMPVSPAGRARARGPA